MRRSALLSVFVACLLFTVSHAQDDEDVLDAPDALENDEYAEVEEAERAFLLVRKSITEQFVIQGRNVTVYLDVFNSGVSTAFGVQLRDSLPSNAKLVAGSLELALANVQVGSHVKANYTIVFTVGAVELELPQAQVAYRAEFKSTSVQTGLSSKQYVIVLTPVQQIARYALQAGKYVSLGMASAPSDWRNLIIIVGTIGGLLGANWSVKFYRSHSSDRKRTAALKSLQ
ncbi:MAG: hypothetical protein WDW38_008718 [Sanguina aurantia]